MTNLNNSIEKPKFPSEDDGEDYGYIRYEDSYDSEREEEINHGVEDFASEESEGEDEF
jgi:hypothetical protein